MTIKYTLRKADLILAVPHYQNFDVYIDFDPKTNVNESNETTTIL